MSKTVPEGERSVEKLACDLTNEERIKFGAELAGAVNRLMAAEGAKTSIVKQLNADVESAEAEVKRVTNIVTQGFEVRDVECTLELNRKTKIASLYRNDTGNIVRARPMSDLELQPKLPMGPAPEVDIKKLLCTCDHKMSQHKDGKCTVVGCDCPKTPEGDAKPPEPPAVQPQ